MNLPASFVLPRRSIFSASLTFLALAPVGLAQGPSQGEHTTSHALVGRVAIAPTSLPFATGELLVFAEQIVPASSVERLTAHYEELLEREPALRAYPVYLQWLHLSSERHRPHLDETLTIVSGTEDTTHARQPDGSCDERVQVGTTTNYPWRTICYTNHKHTGGGWKRCSGTIVSRYMVLTAGHCVYDRGTSDFYDEFKIMPGRNGSTFPYTTYTTTRRNTNSAYTTASSSNRHNYDYGALFTTSQLPFGTTMPVKFDYSANNGNIVNMSGYPGTDPSGNTTRAQWRDADPITSSTSRKMWYDIKSVGGASGSPVWRYISSSGRRDIVAVNVSHSTSCNGIGTRMVSQNRNLITSWMAWTPNDGPTYRGLPRTLDPDDLLTEKELGLTTITEAEAALLQPSRGYAQLIQDTLYSWDEYDIPMPDSGVRVGIKLLLPFERVLTIREARILLSASRVIEVVDPPGSPGSAPTYTDAPATDPEGSPVATGSIPTIDVGALPMGR